MRRHYISPCSITRTCFLIFLFLATFAGRASAQYYANIRTSSGLISYDIVLGALTSPSATTSATFGSVTDTNFVTDPDHTNAATLTAKCFNIAILGYAGEAWIQPKFDSVLPAGGTAYFRIDMPYSSGGISLDVLGLVGELTNLFNKDIIIVSAYSGATTTGAGTQLSAAKVRKALVRDSVGNLYVAVTADSTFNSARIGLRFNTGLLGVSLGAAISMKVYYGVQYKIPACSGRPSYTDMGAYSAGLTVSVLDSVVKNPVNAIDDNLTTFSRLGGSSLLSVGLASRVDQTFFLPAAASTNDDIRVTLSTPGTILDLGLANQILVGAYKGNTLVSEQSLGSLLSLDLLGLLSSSSGFAVYVNPGGVFDKIKVSYSHLLGASLIGSGINIYDVRYVPRKPAVSKDTATIYKFTRPVVTATTDASNEIRWYNSMNTMIGTGTSFPNTDTIAVAGRYHARAAKIDCNSISDTAHVYLKVVSLTYTNPVVGTQGVVYTGVVASLAGPGISGAGFRFTMASGSSLPAGLTLNSNGNISGTPAVTDTMTFTTNLRDTVNDLDAGQHAYLLTIRAPLVLPAQVLPDAVEGVAYSTVLPPATGGTGIYTYTLSVSTPLPAGMSFNPLTRTVSGIALSGLYTFTIDAEDTEGRTTSQVYSLFIGTALPVQLISFDGVLNGDVAVLKWKMTNESTVRDMQVQRSTDGTAWADRELFPSRHSRSGTTDYSSNDAVTGLSGTILYRLKITELNNKEFYTQVIKLVKSVTPGAELAAYPNPASRNAQIYFRAGQTNVIADKVIITNAMGRQVYEAAGIGSMDAGLLPAGSYMIRFVTSGTEVTTKLVIE